jgi:hypothetical protein
LDREQEVTGSNLARVCKALQSFVCNICTDLKLVVLLGDINIKKNYYLLAHAFISQQSKLPTTKIRHFYKTAFLDIKNS